MTIQHVVAILFQVAASKELDGKLNITLITMNPPSFNTDSAVIHKTGPCTTPPLNPALTFSYEPDHFQNHSFNAMDQGHHVLVTAHTGSGKTTVAEYAVAHGIKTGKRVIYTSPIKALSNQIYGDFHRKYPDWSIGIRTGDIDYRSDNAQVVIMTTEILQNMLYRREAEDDDDSNIPTIDFDNVSVVIFDEVHYIKDKDRGSVWERSIMMMPEHIQMVMLSATLPDADQFCRWIANCKHKTVTHTTTPYRAVPLTHYIMTERGMNVIMDKDNKFYDDTYRQAMDQYTFVPSDLDRYIGRMKLPALFFCFSKKHCQQYAKCIRSSVTTTEERLTINKKLEKLIRKFPNHAELKTVEQTKEVFSLASKGVCYHHAGLLPPLKEIIQELFSDGLIKVLFVTETFAAGVNMPAKTVVFTGLTKYDDSVAGGGFRVLLPEEYGQMSGRAGRRGMDTIGTVIHLPFNVHHHPDQTSVKEMMCGNIRNIVSRIKPDYHHAFNSILFKTDIMSSGSMQDRDRKKRIEVLHGKIKPLEKELEYEMKQLEEYETKNKDILTEELYDKLDYYKKYHNGELKGKAAKRYHKSNVEEWYRHNQDTCDTLIKLEEKIYGLEQRIEDCGNELEYLECGDEDDLVAVTDFLSANGYLRGDKALHEYTPDDLTAKGVMASSINEGNCLLLTELIVEDYLDDLDCHELVAVLALFLGGKETNRELSIPDKVKNRLTMIDSYAQQFAVAESKFSPFESDWEVHKEFCDMAYWWSKTGLVGQVYTKTGSIVQVGEFTRMMIKLNNVCRETLRAAQIAQKDKLAIRLRECQENLIQGVVYPQSLYVMP